MLVSSVISLQEVGVVLGSDEKERLGKFLFPKLLIVGVA
jgi:hypothetical protein